MRTHPYSLGLVLAAFAGTQPAWGQFTITRQFAVNQSIPDGGDLLNAQTVDLGGGTISEVRLSLNIARGSVGPGFNGDLYVGLGHSTGYAVLINRPGRSAADDFGYADGDGFNVTFADTAPGDVHNYRLVQSGNHNTALTGPLTGLWQPDGRNTDPSLVLDSDSRTRMLANFIGLAASGEWRLFLSDVSAGGLSKLSSWALSVTKADAPGMVSALAGDTLEFTSPGATFTEPVAVTGNNTITGAQGATLAGTLSGTGTLTKTGIGALTLTAANTFSGGVTVTEGTLVVNNTSGSATGSGPVVVGSGATLTGSGRISGEVTLQTGARISPGSSPGTLSTGSETWAGGGQYTWEINLAGGTAGSDPGWDLLDITGGLSITATSGNKFQIDLTSLGSDNLAGPTPGFNSALNYSWTIVTTSSGITGFDSIKFNLDTTGFQNSLGGGSFGLGLANGNKDLLLSFTSVPEPTTYGLLTGFGLLGLALWRRHQARPNA